MCLNFDRGTPRPGTIGGNSAGSPSAPAQPPLPVAHLPAGPHQQPGAPQNPNPIGWNLPNAAGQPKIYPTMSPGNNPGHPLAPAGNNNPSQTIVNINSNSQPPSPSIIPVPVILAVPSIGESNRYHHYQPPSNTAVNHTEIIINNYHNGAAVPSNSTTPQNITSTPIANSSFSQITVTTKITASKSSSNRLQHYAATTILLFILHAFINANINK